MTDSFGASAPVNDDSSADDRRKKMMAGGLLAAVVLGAGAYFFLGSGEAEEDFTVVKPVRPAKTAPATGAAAKPAGTASKPVVLPAAGALTPGRNPYKALYVAPESSGGGGTTTGGVVAPPVLPTSPLAPTAPVAPVVPVAPVAPVTPEDPEPTSYALTLKKVVGTNGLAQSTFAFGGKEVTVIRGQRFGTYGELVVLSFDKNVGVPTLDVVLQVGDGAPFAMRVGQTRQVL